MSENKKEADNCEFCVPLLIEIITPFMISIQFHTLFYFRTLGAKSAVAVAGGDGKESKIIVEPGASIFNIYFRYFSFLNVK